MTLSSTDCSDALKEIHCHLLRVCGWRLQRRVVGLCYCLEVYQMACIAVPQLWCHFPTKSNSGISPLVCAQELIDAMAKYIAFQFTMLVRVFASGVNEACSAFSYLSLFLCGDRRLWPVVFRKFRDSFGRAADIEVNWMWFLWELQVILQPWLGHCCCTTSTTKHVIALSECASLKCPSSLHRFLEVVVVAGQQAGALNCEMLVNGFEASMSWRRVGSFWTTHEVEL